MCTVKKLIIDFVSCIINSNLMYLFALFFPCSYHIFTALSTYHFCIPFHPYLFCHHCHKSPYHIPMFSLSRAIFFLGKYIYLPIIHFKEVNIFSFYCLSVHNHNFHISYDENDILIYCIIYTNSIHTINTHT